MKKKFKELKEKLLNHCKHCNGKGWFLDSLGLQTPCLCMKELFAIAACDKGEVPLEYWEYTIDCFKGDKNVLQLVNNILIKKEKEDMFFLLSGKYRIGKTTLAVCIAKAYHKLQGMVSIFYVTARNLESSLFSEEQKAIERAYDADFLIIDDLGKESTFSTNDPNKRVIRGILDQIIRQRRRYKPTIITTNLDKPSLVTFYGKNLQIMFENDFNFIQWPEQSEMLNMRGN